MDSAARSTDVTSGCQKSNANTARSSSPSLATWWGSASQKTRHSPTRHSRRSPATSIQAPSGTIRPMWQRNLALKWPEWPLIPVPGPSTEKYRVTRLAAAGRESRDLGADRGDAQVSGALPATAPEEERLPVAARQQGLGLGMGREPAIEQRELLRQARRKSGSLACPREVRRSIEGPDVQPRQRKPPGLERRRDAAEVSDVNVALLRPAPQKVNSLHRSPVDFDRCCNPND